MRNVVLLSFIVLCSFLLCTPVAFAQSVFDPTTTVPNNGIAPDGEVATSAAIQTESQVIPKADDSNITTVQTPVQSELTSIIDSRQITSPSMTNFVQYAIRIAMQRGIPINVIVFLLLFPLISSVIAIARHVIGLTGFSMFAPAALAVALLSIGIVPGSALFVSVIVLSAIGKSFLPYLKLPYMPRTAMLLWFVSIGMFCLLLISTYIPFFSLSIPNLFALLILVLLSENFLEIQSSRTPWVAIQRAAETFILALFCVFILDSRIVQASVLLYPEIFLLSVAVINFITGKYLGLRLSEWFRFRNLMETEE